MAVGGDTYQDKVAKYIPGEVVAGYMALDRTLLPDVKSFHEKASLLAEAVSNPKGTSRALGIFQDPAMHLFMLNTLPALVLLAGLVFTPLYIRQLAVNSGDTTSWRTQAMISTVAFLVWAYAIQGSAFTLGHGEGLYAGNWASVLLILFTLGSGLFGPAPVRPDRGATRQG